MKKTTEKKLWIVLFTIVIMMALTICASAWDDAAVYSGYCGEGNPAGTNVSYTLNAGELRITGSGRMGRVSFSGENSSSETDVRTVIIDSGVSNIGAYAFQNFSSLQSVILPDSIKTIDDYAFDGCKSLQSITLPEYVTSIGEGAFHDCWMLQSIAIPDTTTTIGANAFYGCVMMQCASTGNGVKTIEEGTFAHCCFLQDVLLGDSVEEIADEAFSDCYSLRSLVLPASLKQVGTIHATLDQKIVVRGAETELSSFEILSPTLDENEYVSAEEFDLVSVPLWEAIIPEEWKKTEMLGEMSSLAFINYVGGPAAFAEIVYEGDTDAGIAFTRRICGGISYYLTESANDPSLPNLKPVVFGYSDSPAQTFSTENSLSFVDVTAEVASGDCGDDARWSLDGLGTLTISGTGAMWDYSAEDENELPPYFTNGNEILSVVINDGITRIGECAFVLCGKSQSQWWSDDTVWMIGGMLTNVTIPSSVTSIGSAAFSNCYHLREVVIPDSVTSIETNAYEHCKFLKRVTLPCALTSLETGLFVGCKNLTEIEIPASVKTIGVGAFAVCDALQKATILSPDCSFVDEMELDGQVYSDMAKYAFPETTVIYGYTGSTSETYASTYRRQFVSIDAHTHVYTSTVTTPATCTSKGVMTYSCTCGVSYTEDIAIDSNNHAALNENGDCPRCGKHVKDVEKPSEPTTEPSEQKPAEKLNFFQRIIQWILNFFAKLFGR